MGRLISLIISYWARQQFEDAEYARKEVDGGNESALRFVFNCLFRFDAVLVLCIMFIIGRACWTATNRPR